jgi:carbonic anhydrase
MLPKTQNMLPIRRVLACASFAALTMHGPVLADEDASAPLEQRLAEKLKDPSLGLKVVNKARDDAGRAKSTAAKAKVEPKMPSLPAPSQWAYAGDASPLHWAELTPENRLCGMGLRQSPIDIRDTIKVDLEKIQFDYRPGSFSVLDNGHTIQVNVAPGNALQVMGRRFELVEFHFHRPSEQRVNGRSYEMEIQLVHKDADGNQAIVALLVERGSDSKPQPTVQMVWNNLPLERNEALTAGMPLDPNQLLPQDRAYFTTMGSTTTPPCAENVLWMVMRTPIQLTANQIGIFARLYPMNARPLQATAGRLIKESN